MQNLQKKLTRTLAVGLILIMGFVLAGCEGVAAGKLNIDLSFDKEGRLTGTYKLVVNTALVEEELSASGASLDKDEVSKQLDRLVDDLESDAPEGMTVEKIDTESEAGLNITLDEVPSGEFDIDGLEGPDALVNINSDFISVGLANPVQPEALLNHGLPADPSEVLTEAQMTLTLPGNIDHDTGGEVNGNTVTYDLLTYDDFAIAVSAPLSSGPFAATGFPWMFMAILIGGTVLPIIIGVVIVVIVVKRQKNSGQHQRLRVLQWRIRRRGNSRPTRARCPTAGRTHRGDTRASSRRRTHPTIQGRRRPTLLRGKPRQPAADTFG